MNPTILYLTDEEKKVLIGALRDLANNVGDPDAPIYEELLLKVEQAK